MPEHAQTILIVDDNPANLQMLVEYLKKYSYKTSVASDGEIAVMRAKHLKPDLILLDVLMPGMNGFETCRQLKADETTKDIPVIFMTALGYTDSKVQGFQEGGVDYITKPVQLEEVLARVSTHLQIRELTRHLAQQAGEIRLLNERLKAENVQVRSELRETEQKYKTLVEKITDGYVVIKHDRIVFANQAFCDMHGYTLQEVLGADFLQMAAPESRPQLQALLGNSAQLLPTSHLYQYLRLTRQQQALTTEMTLNPFEADDQDVLIIAICRDITERVEMERRVREAERMACIGGITTSLSHELRNPLSAIKMNLQMLEEYNPLLDEDGRKNVAISIKEVMRLERILTEILDFAKPIRLNLHPCSLNEVLTSCVDILHAKFIRKGIAVTCSFDPDITVIRADEEKLGQIVINLLLNAFEASSPNAAICLTSRSHGESQPAGVEILVEDEGCGIHEDRFADLCTPFFTTKQQGTGLGLTNVKHWAEAHGGWLRAENRHPRGARFRVWLPL